MQPNQANLSLQKLVAILKAKGFSDDKIADIGVEMAKNAFMLMYSNGVAAFTEEDVKAIDACETEDKGNEKIAELYALRTGKNVQDDLNVFLTKVAEEYMAAIEKDPSLLATEAQAPVMPAPVAPK